MVDEAAGPDRELAEAKVAAAADARRALRREREVAAAEATLDGVLHGLAAGGMPVVVVTERGRARGAVVATGIDFVELAATGGQIASVRVAAVVAVEVAGDAGQVLGLATRPGIDRTLGEVVADFAETGEAVELVCRGGRTFEGVVTGCGIDVATVRGAGGAVSYVALDSVNEVWSSSMP
jgi:hypothetical protein